MDHNTHAGDESQLQPQQQAQFQQQNQQNQQKLKDQLSQQIPSQSSHGAAKLKLQIKTSDASQPSHSLQPNNVGDKVQKLNGANKQVYKEIQDSRDGKLPCFQDLQAQDYKIQGVPSTTAKEDQEQTEIRENQKFQNNLEGKDGSYQVFQSEQFQQQLHDLQQDFVLMNTDFLQVKQDFSDFRQRAYESQMQAQSQLLCSKNKQLQVLYQIMQSQQKAGSLVAQLLEHNHADLSQDKISNTLFKQVKQIPQNKQQINDQSEEEQINTQEDDLQLKDKKMDVLYQQISLLSKQVELLSQRPINTQALPRAGTQPLIDIGNDQGTILKKRKGRPRLNLVREDDAFRSSNKKSIYSENHQIQGEDQEYDLDNDDLDYKTAGNNYTYKKMDGEVPIKRKVGRKRKIKGVTNNNGKWLAYLHIDGKQYGLGSYTNKYDGARAYDIFGLVANRDNFHLNFSRTDYDEILGDIKNFQLTFEQVPEWLRRKQFDFNRYFKTKSFYRDFEQDENEQELENEEDENAKRHPQLELQCDIYYLQELHMWQALANDNTNNRKINLGYYPSQEQASRAVDILQLQNNLAYSNTFYPVEEYSQVSRDLDHLSLNQVSRVLRKQTFEFKKYFNNLQNIDGIEQTDNKVELDQVLTTSPKQAPSTRSKDIKENEIDNTEDGSRKIIGAYKYGKKWNVYQTQQGRAKFLGSFENQHIAARVHDLCKLKNPSFSLQNPHKRSKGINYPQEDYKQILADLSHMSLEKVCAKVKNNELDFRKYFQVPLEQTAEDLEMDQREVQS